MAALPYSMEWVGVTTEHADATEVPFWHLQWLGDPDGGKTLCMIHSPEPVANHKKWLGNTFMVERFCPRCKDLFTRIVYMRIEDGKPTDDLRM